MPPLPWSPMHTAPSVADRVWLNHLTLGPILAEGRPGRWYAPSAARQVWRWYRPAGAEALEPFSGWLPFEALAVEQAGEEAPAETDPFGGLSGARPSPSGRRAPPAPFP
ncbi:hypothetical protein [Methylobacterium sp. J-068]|uniref:hypothetical protein n=1 Tax=Methylobacterium sp. J-068 TaxID=2836649 RepID=UPI001FBC0290|nr:hypothetical protein [Methylobacterium sp. J-068]MCJ2033999.1 hypothetical protein [Methylobacterium sp. J-068]